MSKTYAKRAAQTVVRDPGFRIFITSECYAKIVTMYLAVETEVGGLLACYNEGKNFFVTDVDITEQTVTGSEVDFTQEGIDEALFRAVENDVMIGGWIHSHADMSAFWSTTDEASIKKLREYTGSWLLSIVGNRRIELLGRIDYKETSAFGDDYVYVDNVPIIIIPDVTEETRTAITTTISEKVTVKKYAAVSGGYGKYGYYAYGAALDEKDDWGVSAYNPDADKNKQYASIEDIEKDQSLDELSDEEYFALIEQYGWSDESIDDCVAEAIESGKLLNVGI